MTDDAPDDADSERDTDTGSPYLPPTRQAVYDAVADPKPTDAVVEHVDAPPNAVTGQLGELARVGLVEKTDDGDWRQADNLAPADVYDAPADAGREDLRRRERYIYQRLPASVATLADDLNVAPAVVEAHLATIEDKGWSLESDDAGNYLGPDQDHLRSSEHTGTRTRTANRWWQRRHDELVHEFQQLDWPRTSRAAFSDHEDWVLHLTDVHVGDRVRRDDGRVVYDTDRAVEAIDYVTGQALALADRHGAIYDAAHILWGGDMLTNEGIYEGQFEDLDAWLDEQHDAIVDPLLRQVKAFADRFPAVYVICQVGNHGRHRASGTSRQANADLVLYKTVRNAVAAIREHGETDHLENVQFAIGEARNYRNFALRDGSIRGHLRHGQQTKPQATTAAGKRDWRGWLLDHDFDVAYAGHHHVSGRIPWDGPPVFFSGSPKPAGEFVEGLGGRSPREHRDIATVHGVSDDGLTSAWPIDTRNFTPDA